MKKLLSAGWLQKQVNRELEIIENYMDTLRMGTKLIQEAIAKKAAESDKDSTAEPKRFYRGRAIDKQFLN